MLKLFCAWNAAALSFGQADPAAKMKTGGLKHGGR